MKYYKLMYAFNESENYVSCNAGDMQGMSEYSAIMGDSIGTKWVPPTLVYNQEEGNIFSDYLHNTYGWLLVSSNFMNNVQPFIEDSVEYLNVSILNSKDGSSRTDYKVANIVDVLDALDLGHSVFDSYDIDGEKIISVRKYALKSDVIKNHHIFKLTDERVPVFVSEKIKKIIDKKHMTGFSFIQVQIV